jgi:hypothetical protein
MHRESCELCQKGQPKIPGDHGRRGRPLHCSCIQITKSLFSVFISFYFQECARLYTEASWYPCKELSLRMNLTAVCLHPSGKFSCGPGWLFC